ncbi:hypothetical protein Tco_0551609 [Tanacetum coccineum]
MTLKEVDGKTIQEFETKIIAKDGSITRVPGTFQGYETSEEDLVERPRRRNLKWPKKRRSGPSSSNDNENPDIAAIIAQQLQTILPEIVTQVTNNVNNANNGNRGNGGGGNGNGGNNGCTTSKAFQSCNPMEYVWKGVQIARTVGSEKNGKCDR